METHVFDSGEKTSSGEACGEEVSGEKTSGEEVCGEEASGERTSSDEACGEEASGERISREEVCGEHASTFAQGRRSDRDLEQRSGFKNTRRKVGHFSKAGHIVVWIGERGIVEFRSNPGQDNKISPRSSHPSPQRFPQRLR